MELQAHSSVFFCRCRPGQICRAAVALPARKAPIRSPYCHVFRSGDRRGERGPRMYQQNGLYTSGLKRRISRKVR